MKKVISYKQKIQNAFNFIYAGVCTVFITTSGTNYVLVTTGFTYDGTNYFFGKNRHSKYRFDSLYKAIESFNEVVNVLTSTTDWYYNEFFNKEFEQLYNKDVY